MLLWGLIVAGSLVLGSLPALVGLVFVVPVLGHATWHLYRKAVASSAGQGLNNYQKFRHPGRSEAKSRRPRGSAVRSLCPGWRGLAGRPG